MTLRNSVYGMFYGCSNYPECKATHGAHKATGEPLGIPADQATRKWRVKAHTIFDQLWNGENRIATRHQAYHILMDIMAIHSAQAHIGTFTINQCQELIEKVEQYRLSIGSPVEWKQRAKEAFYSLWGGKTPKMRKQAAVSLIKDKLGFPKEYHFDIEKLEVVRYQRIIEIVENGLQDGKK
jgi:ssDNA-binding Zn-finger/Zn-ribbon topoisomerase 1